jgi:nucleotide-binding universal stress UspA family protein
LARAEAEEYLDDLAVTLEADGLPITTRVLQGHAAEQILCLADRETVDLVVLASHGEKGVTEWSLGSTAQKIVDRARTSLLVAPVARSGPQCPAGVGRLERILVPLDGSPAAESVLPVLRRLARDQNVVLGLLHVVAASEMLPIGPPSADDEELENRLRLRNERVARQYLAEVRTALVREGCSVREILEWGDLRSVLPRIAVREEIDLVAIAAHGMSSDRGSCLGATAGQLVCHAQLPTLLIQNLPQPGPEFAEAVRHRREAAPTTR